jgi:hypothetical protein
MDDWRPISSLPLGKGDLTPWAILGHSEKRWIRFGQKMKAANRWYYSGTNERCQWAQAIGDEPTHWMPMPTAPVAHAS